jgi:hypothetical protein
MSNWGGKRPGAGRPRGSKNQDTVYVQEQLEALDCRPLELLAWIASGDSGRLGSNEQISMQLRLKAASTLAEYLYPRRRAVEATFEQGNSLLEVLKGIADEGDQTNEN